MATHFGEHLTMNGAGGDSTLLDDRGAVWRCLHELPLALGLSILGGPALYRARGNDDKDPDGRTSTCVIRDSLGPRRHAD